MPSALAKPSLRPVSPNFSCGPCTRHPGWSLSALKDAALGRSHRSKLAKDRLKRVIDESHALLELPDDYIVAIMGGSDTGAVEAALWSLLGPRPVDVFAWESFGKDWVTDCLTELTSIESHGYTADFGKLPDLGKADFNHDVVFTWNGTTSGVIVPNADWIPDDRKGLVICDATSSALAVPMPWRKLDVVTYSWQKVLGSEAQHGMLILGPRAVERLESHKPAWPVPKLFRLTKGGKLNKAIFEGEIINTPSMLCVEDALDAMAWARRVGGMTGLAARAQANAKTMSDWVAHTKWVKYLCEDASLRSPTAACLVLAEPEMAALSADAQAAFCKKIVAMLEEEGVAFDINSYRDAPPGFRVWCGSTVEAGDIVALTQWMDWAYATVRAQG